MPHLIYSDRALNDLRRLRVFLMGKNAPAASRASKVILFHLDVLEVAPDIGRLVGEGPSRQLVIPFANAGYVARYEHDAVEDVVVVQTIRHQLEESAR